MKRLLTLAALSICTASLISTSGCARKDEHPISLIAAVDVSCPSQTLTNRYGTMLYRVQRNIEPGDGLAVSAFASTVRPIYQGQSLGSRGAFNERVGTALLSVASSREKPGTRTDQLLAELARAAEKESRPAVIVIFTDGGMEDTAPAVMASIRSSIQRMSKRRSLKYLILAGVLPQHRSRWSRLLEPLGPRGLVRGMNDCEDALDVHISLAKTGAESEG